MSCISALSAQADTINSQYPQGTRIRLIIMKDPKSPIPPKTCGTVDFVDDLGQILVEWDNGKHAMLRPGIDCFAIA